MELAITDFGGTGQPLVLGPSIGTTTSQLWGEVASQLTDRFQVLGWELPGHGRTGAEAGFELADLASAILDTVDGQFDYAGVSLGGAVGLQLLVQAPERLRTATLLATSAQLGEPAGWRDRAARVRRDGLAWLVAETPARWFAPGNRETDAAGVLLGELAATDPRSYAYACDALATFDLRDRLGEIAVPVLAVAGADDPVTPPASLAAIADGVRHGRLVVLDGAAHQLPVERPDAVAELIRAHAGK